MTATQPTRRPADIRNLRIDRRTVLGMTASTLIAAATSHVTPVAGAETVAAFPELVDSRLGPQKDLNGYFPFEVPSTLDAWKERAEFVRRQTLVACGLWPMPPKHDMKPVIHGRIDRDDYTVDKVILESSPGLFVTGHLYRPKGFTGKRPAVLSPHGHAPEGRFHQHSDKELEQELKSGAEQFPVGGRHPIQARCVHLARMGCVVFVYDMLGYADRGGALPQPTAHTIYEQRPEVNEGQQWGLGSPQAELRCINPMGLQTWNSIRALDFLLSLPDVDQTKVGVTGESGGGTQTFILGAVDERPTALFPVVMVSTAMQGGCTCENASYLRLGTGNIELAALIAPRPLGMAGADDWTKEIETKGLPELRKLYGMYGAEDKLFGRYLPFPHNYNAASRSLMYQFFNQHLGLGLTEIPAERDYRPIGATEGTVWNSQYPSPAQTIENEVAICANWNDLATEPLKPDSQTKKHSATQTQILRGGWDVLIGRKLPARQAVTAQTISETESSGLTIQRMLLANAARNEQVPCEVVVPAAWNREVVIYLHKAGKAGLTLKGGALAEPVKVLLDGGYAVVGCDLLFQGESLKNQPTERATQARLVKNHVKLDGYAGYTFCYNSPLFSQRVHDVLTVVRATADHPERPSAIHLLGIGEAAAWAAAAALQSGPVVSKLAINPARFAFDDVTSLSNPAMLPGAVKYGDVDGLLDLLPNPMPPKPQGSGPRYLALATAQWLVK